MAVQSVPFTERRDWRTIVFRVVAGLIALFLLAISVPTVFWPWNIMPLPLADVPSPELWRWHVGTWSIYAAVLAAGPLLALLLHPRGKPLLMQYWLLGQIIVAILWQVASWPTVEPDQYILIALVLLSYPAPRALLRLRGSEPLSRPLLLLALLTALALAPAFWQNLRLHFSPVADQFQESGQYMHATYITLLVPLTALLAATKRSGWRMLSLLGALTLIYLGLAAVTVPDHPGSWGLVGGVASLLGGATFLAVPHWLARPAA